jgi:hypothetical protein
LQRVAHVPLCNPALQAAKPLCRDALIDDMPAIAIVSVGTRGDVQPFIALALQLKAKGQ